MYIQFVDFMELVVNRYYKNTPILSLYLRLTWYYCVCKSVVKLAVSH